MLNYHSQVTRGNSLEKRGNGGGYLKYFLQLQGSPELRMKIAI